MSADLSASEIHRYGINLLQREEYQRAEAFLKEAVTLEPDNAVYNNDFGLCLARQDRYPEAERFYRKALELEPGNALCNVYLGVCLDDQDRRSEAVLFYRRAVELDPGSSVCAYYFSCALDILEQHQEAWEYAAIALSNARKSRKPVDAEFLEELEEHYDELKGDAGFRGVDMTRGVDVGEPPVIDRHTLEVPKTLPKDFDF